MTQVSTFTIGTTGDPVLDALFVTQESFFLPFEDRAFFAGDTIGKWGGGIGTGAAVTYSFFEAEAWFPPGYGETYISSIGTIPDQVKDHIRDAFAVWSRYADVTLTEQAEIGSNVGDVRVGLSLSNPSFQPPINSTAEAVPPSWPNPAVIGDIFLSAEYVQDPALFVPGVSHHFTTMLHEIGHSVFNLQDVTINAGLDGAILPPEQNYRTQTIMSYSVVPGATVGDGAVNQGGLSYWPTTPMVLDVWAAQWLYGANQSHATGNDTYTFSQQQTYHETIWDAGGNDTISVAGNSKAATINLTPGSYSDVGSVITAFVAQGQTTITETVGIAFGAVIENAIGGSGNDTLTGNAADNQLTGGAGNDTINGGTGGGDVAVYNAASTAVTITAAGGVITVNATSSGEGIDQLTGIERLQFSDGVFELLPDGTIQPFNDTPSPLVQLFTTHADTAKGLAATHELLLGGVPNEAGFQFLIQNNITTNYGAGPGPVFNAENIYINLANALYQGSAEARAAFTSLAPDGTLGAKLVSVYQALVPAASQTAAGQNYFVSQQDFYTARAAELGIPGIHGAAVVGFAALLKIVADADLGGIGDAVNDLYDAIVAGSAAIPSSGNSFTPIEVADGSAFDGDDVSAMARAAASTEPAPFVYADDQPGEAWSGSAATFLIGQGPAEVG